MPIVVNLTCENTMLTDIFTYDSVLMHAQIGRVLNRQYATICLCHGDQKAIFVDPS